MTMVKKTPYHRSLDQDSPQLHQGQQEANVSMTNSLDEVENLLPSEGDVETSFQTNPDEEAVDETWHNKDSASSSALISSSVLVALQISNIICWYWTNGMNGIAMQAYAGQVLEATGTNKNDGTNGYQRYMSSRFWMTLQITSGITCLQLLLGACIGRMLLFVINKQITWAQICMTRSLPLSSLHAGGSLATNLGFMYGKASVVQVIKLLEPFETLILSQILFREGNFSIGIISSMILVVGAAMSLLKLQSKPVLPQAIAFALLSGITLSTRNVLQRKHHHTSSTSSAATTKSWTKLEKSVVQFTQLSFFSGLWMAGLTSILWLLVNAPPVPASFQVYFWHPLYNVFSMITLGFCSALTHSLLNAGKRVFAICMAMIWFAEGLNLSTISGLLAVASGGGWYSWESKRRTGPSSNGDSGDGGTTGSDTFRSEFYKLILSISVLVLLFTFHNNAAK